MPTDKPQFPSDRADKFMLRFPDGMREQIAEAAKANGRSMNSEIVARLASSFRLPAMVDRLVDAQKVIDAGDTKKDALIADMIRVSEAQKEISDQQEHLIEQLLKLLPLIPDEDGGSPAGQEVKSGPESKTAMLKPLEAVAPKPAAPTEPKGPPRRRKRIPR